MRISVASGCPPHDVKRKKPFLGVRQYVDEDDYEERADRFIEYHEEIVDEDQSE